MCRIRFGFCAIILTGAMSSALAAEKQQARRTDRSPDLDGEPIAVLIPRANAPAGEVAVAQGSCATIGDFLQAFSNQDAIGRHRGNVYHFDVAAKLAEIQMELSFEFATDLYVGVYRKDPDGVWRLVKGILIPNAPASESVARFYSTGTISPPIDLAAGFDYAVLYGWGDGNVIFWGRDFGPYPGATPPSFDEGQVLGLVGGNNFTPPFPSTLPLGTPSSAGAYSQILCFKPVAGACCSDALPITGARGCSEVLETECLASDAGAFFHGERTLCLETVCRFGACCGPCSTCDDGYTTESCSAGGGVRLWVDAICPEGISPSLCRPVTGACCTPSDGCLEICEDECTALGGTYRGDDTSCDPDPCVGACCLADLGLACLEMPRSSCNDLGGPYAGDGTTCDALSPALECGGACCLGAGGLNACSVVSERSACAWDALPVPGGQAAYRGDATVCPSDCGVLDVASYGACCMPDGVCIHMPTPGTTCEDSGGSFNAGFLCDANSCPTSACCLPDGSCSVLTSQGCTDRGGSWQAVPTCAEAICPTGACCESNEGRCTVLTPDACANNVTGSYAGDGTTCAAPAEVCDASLDFGACCVSGLECVDALTSTECTARNGVHTLGVTCESDLLTDCDRRGACCTQTGVCLFVLQSECDDPDLLGVFQGVGKPCVSDTCPIGACCHDDTCTIMGETYCRRVDGLNGVYAGDGTDCSTESCEVGACCTGGTCQEETRFQCEDGGGRFVSAGSTCADTGVCTFGACCDGGICFDGNADLANEFVCRSGGGFFAGKGAVCDFDTCQRGACCFEQSCTETMLEQECLDAGGFFAGRSTNCGEDCGRGACCQDDLCTELTLQADCESTGGLFAGERTDCSDALLCASGACMDGSCVCTDAVLGFQCPDSCGDFRFGLTCADVSCRQQLLDSDPLDCTIDARQPHDPFDAADTMGWDSIELTMLYGAECIDDLEFELITSSPTLFINDVAQVDPGDAGTVRLSFNEPIPTGEFTCILHTDTAAQVCLGFSPANVDGDGLTEAADVDDLKASLQTPFLDLWECDQDRSGVCTPLDLLREMDLLNGAEQFAEWDQATLPACPLAP